MRPVKWPVSIPAEPAVPRWTKLPITQCSLCSAYLICLLCLICLFSFTSLIIFATSFHSCSQIFPGPLLPWLRPLPSHWPPGFSHRSGLSDVCSPRLSLLLFQLQLLTCVLPVSTFYQIFSLFTRRFLTEIHPHNKTPPLFIFLYTSYLSNHSSQRNSFKKNGNRVTLCFSLFLSLT